MMSVTSSIVTRDDFKPMGIIPVTQVSWQQIVAKNMACLLGIDAQYVVTYGYADGFETGDYKKANAKAMEVATEYPSIEVRA